MERKRLFNFYLDPEIKDEVQAKLERLIGETPKGAMSALIRVMLKQFIATPDAKVNPLLIQAIDAEYQYSAKLNKRSRN